VIGLMMFNFEPTSFRTESLHDGVKHIFEFRNGFGASVIRHSRSYGGKEGLWELGVLKDGRLCYDTPITDNVLGYLTESQVEDALNDILMLNPAFAQKT